MSDIVTVRNIDIITTEIKMIEQQVAKAAVYGCIEIGKRLVEAKEMVGHGGWGKYLEEKVRYSQQWATNLMNLSKQGAIVGVLAVAQTLIIITGGIAKFIIPMCKTPMIYDKDLLLKGLNIIYKKNKR